MSTSPGSGRELWDVRLAHADDEEVQLERGVDDKGNPERDPRLQTGRKNHATISTTAAIRSRRGSVIEPSPISATYSGRGYARSVAKVTIDPATGALVTGGRKLFPIALSNAPPADRARPGGGNGLAASPPPA